ncbi:MAG TPA: hypothetical protein VNM14_17735 [Planctomycetota bacterium]|jgi:hypothetical protein|nr:hypothetical protein [Planctomycetota bacterium]
MRGNRILFLALAVAALPACGGGGGDGDSAQVVAATGRVPDFSLVDKNPKSKTHGRSVSPRDYLDLVPGFYFTHAN